MVATSLRLCWSLVLLQNEMNSKHHYKHQHCEQLRGVTIVTQPTSAVSLPLVCTSPSTSHSDCPSPQMHQCRLQGKGRGGGRGGEGEGGGRGDRGEACTWMTPHNCNIINSMIVCITQTFLELFYTVLFLSASEKYQNTVSLQLTCMHQCDCGPLSLTGC